MVTPGRSATAFTASSTPGMNDVAVVGVVADREGLPGGAEEHLLVGDQAPQAHRVDADAGRALAAAGALEHLGAWWGRAPTGPTPPPCARR